MTYYEERVLILTKTYPNPSTKYEETVCVAGITETGQFRRIYPVPYRQLDGEQKFKRWQWITAHFEHTSVDKRPESRRVDIDSIRLGDVIPTNNGWVDRLRWLQPQIVKTFEDLETRRVHDGSTLGCVRVTRLLGLEIKPLPESEREWSPEEKAKLTSSLMQPNLFDPGSGKKPPILRKIPFQFRYVYEAGGAVHNHMITDWEVCTLYLNCLKKYGDNWMEPFNKKLDVDFKKVDMHLLLGTQHRFPDQWLIIGLIYPKANIQTSMEF